MTEQNPFKWRHFEAEVILLCIRWYLRYALSYRDLEEMMLERGLHVDHTTIYRWVQRYAPELEKRCRPHLKVCNDSWKVDETYKGEESLDVSLPSRGFSRKNNRVSLESDTGCRGGDKLLPQSLAILNSLSLSRLFNAWDRNPISPGFLVSPSCDQRR
jgi:hypothetical protein